MFERNCSSQDVLQMHPAFKSRNDYLIHLEIKRYKYTPLISKRYKLFWWRFPPPSVPSKQIYSVHFFGSRGNNFILMHNLIKLLVSFASLFHYSSLWECHPAPMNANLKSLLKIIIIKRYWGKKNPSFSVKWYIGVVDQTKEWNTRGGGYIPNLCRINRL